MNASNIPLLVGRGQKDVNLLPKMANRHGLVAGATGTGKTITLRTLTEGFSRMGVPVFLADVKGDLSGMAASGDGHPKVLERAELLKLEGFTEEAYPVVFWDLFGEQGHPVRTTVSDMGPLLLARLLNLNDTQSGVLSLVFRIADDNGMLLLDLKDLQAMVRYVGDHAKEYRTEYGNISPASIGAIQRRLLTLDDQGGDHFFAEPALNLADFMQTDIQGRGMVNILAADKLILSPKLYATFLLWLLSELFEQLPEVGDPQKPKLVFFFDEAHLLFEDAPKALEDKIEQVEDVLGQLGNRIQHALRAFTPKDQRAVKAAAETFRPNPAIDTRQAITELGVGEALVSVLDAKGSPTMVERALICPPRSRLKPLSGAERDEVVRGSDLYGYYEKEVDRESAYEILKERAAKLQEQASKEPAKKARSRGRQPASLVESIAKSAARAVGSQVGRSLVRGLLGSLFGGRR